MQKEPVQTHSEPRIFQVGPGRYQEWIVDKEGNKVTFLRNVPAKEAEGTKGDEVKPPTPQDAVDKINKYTTALLKLESGDIFTEEFAEFFVDEPGTYGMMKALASGSDIDPELKARAQSVIENTIDFYKQYAPKGFDVGRPRGGASDAGLEIETVPARVGGKIKKGPTTLPVFGPPPRPGWEPYEMGDDGTEYWIDPKTPNVKYPVIRE